jgi:hypothetical protein
VGRPLRGGSIGLGDLMVAVLPLVGIRIRPQYSWLVVLDGFLGSGGQFLGVPFWDGTITAPPPTACP